MSSINYLDTIVNGLTSSLILIINAFAAFLIVRSIYYTSQLEFIYSIHSVRYPLFQIQENCEQTVGLFQASFMMMAITSHQAKSMFFYAL